MVKYQGQIQLLVNGGVAKEPMHDFVYVDVAVEVGGSGRMLPGKILEMIKILRKLRG